MNVRDFVVQYALQAASGASAARSVAKPEDIVLDALDLWHEIQERCPEVGSLGEPVRIPKAKVAKAD